MRRLRGEIRGAGRTFGAARRAYDRSEHIAGEGASRDEVALDVFLDERPAQEEIAARLSEWVSSPGAVADAGAGDGEEDAEEDDGFDLRGRPLVAAAEVARIVASPQRLCTLFEEAVERRGEPCSRRTLDAMFPAKRGRSATAATATSKSAKGRKSDAARPAGGTKVEALLPELARTVSVWNRLRLIDSYGKFSHWYVIGRLLASVVVLFSAMYLSISIWQASTVVESDVVTPSVESGETSPLVLRLLGFLAAAVVIALPGYVRVIAPRIRVLLTGPPSPGRVDSVSISELGRNSSQAKYRQIHWSTLDGKRSGKSSALLVKKADSRFQEGQRITVYCDPENNEGGEIDLLGMF